MVKLAQVCGARHTHAQRHLPCAAKQIAQNWRGVAGGVFKQQRRAVGSQSAVAQSRHLKVGRHSGTDALQLTCGLQLGDKVS